MFKSNSEEQQRQKVKMASDPFDDVFNLEDQYYDQGYKQGYEEGFEAGKIEGRSVGLKTGYEKFLEAGRLQSKAIIWGNRLPNIKTGAGNSASPGDGTGAAEAEKLPVLSTNPRLEKNVSMLYGLVEPGTLSTENNDESVNDFDDRVKRAQGKLKIIERAVGEDPLKEVATDASRPARNEI
ncbi:hypothetical protein BX600DRAFT_458315 [Xylariales sp. PMI_506]|nr:hypothetical protein BX600DRAFT_458315 [Xylariales sp. PMI_506]